jgi:quinol monooxygenase YgiN
MLGLIKREEERVVRVDFLRVVSAVVGSLAIAGVSAAHAGCEEVGYIATFEVKPGSEQAFEQAVVAVAAKVVEVEDGVLLYAPYRGEDGRYFMMERYKNLAAREVHATAPEVQALFPALIEQLAGPIGVEAVTAVCASSE